MVVEVVVLGRAVPKGSLRRGCGGRGLFFPRGVMEWERTVRVACANEMRRSSYPLIDARCRVSLRFYLAPTKAGRLIGDLDKLVRCVLDAMTGVVYRDDELVVGLLASKCPVEPGALERVEIAAMIESATPA
jgi:Holliday junction resolvase RusA-like endonuclease